MNDDISPLLNWPPAEPSEAALADGVHLWCWSLYATEEEAESQHNSLSTAERSRAARFVFRRDWRRYVLAHAGMRHVLAAYTRRLSPELAITPELPIAQLAITQEAGQKPSLADRSDIRFNLSHSANVAVLAITRGTEIGVDVERITNTTWNFPHDQLSAAEIDHLRALPADQAALGFYRCWTHKEALLKAVGTGLLADLQAFSVFPGTGRANARPGAPSAIQALEWWHLREFVPATGYTGCVALHPGENTVRFFRMSSMTAAASVT